VPAADAVAHSSADGRSALGLGNIAAMAGPLNFGAPLSLPAYPRGSEGHQDGCQCNKSDC
jgi:hypothetical protein